MFIASKLVFLLVLQIYSKKTELQCRVYKNGHSFFLPLQCGSLFSFFPKQNMQIEQWQQDIEKEDFYAEIFLLQLLG